MAESWIYKKLRKFHVEVCGALENAITGEEYDKRLNEIKQFGGNQYNLILRAENVFDMKKFSGGDPDYLSSLKNEGKIQTKQNTCSVTKSVIDGGCGPLGTDLTEYSIFSGSANSVVFSYNFRNDIRAVVLSFKIFVQKNPQNNKEAGVRFQINISLQGSVENIYFLRQINYIPENKIVGSKVRYSLVNTRQDQKKKLSNGTISFTETVPNVCYSVSKLTEVKDPMHNISLERYKILNTKKFNKNRLIQMRQVVDLKSVWSINLLILMANFTLLYTEQSSIWDAFNIVTVPLVDLLKLWHFSKKFLNAELLYVSESLTIQGSGRQKTLREHFNLSHNNIVLTLYSKYVDTVTKSNVDNKKLNELTQFIEFENWFLQQQWFAGSLDEFCKLIVSENSKNSQNIIAHELFATGKVQSLLRQAIVREHTLKNTDASLSDLGNWFSRQLSSAPSSVNEQPITNATNPNYSDTGVKSAPSDLINKGVAVVQNQVLQSVADIGDVAQFTHDYNQKAENEVVRASVKNINPPIVLPVNDNVEMPRFESINLLFKNLQQTVVKNNLFKLQPYLTQYIVNNYNTGQTLGSDIKLFDKRKFIIIMNEIGNPYVLSNAYEMISITRTLLVVQKSKSEKIKNDWKATKDFIIYPSEKPQAETIKKLLAIDQLEKFELQLNEKINWLTKTQKLANIYQKYLKDNPELVQDNNRFAKLGISEQQKIYNAYFLGRSYNSEFGKNYEGDNTNYENDKMFLERMGIEDEIIEKVLTNIKNNEADYFISWTTALQNRQELDTNKIVQTSTLDTVKELAQKATGSDTLVGSIAYALSQGALAYADNLPIVSQIAAYAKNGTSNTKISSSAASVLDILVGTTQKHKDEMKMRLLKAKEAQDAMQKIENDSIEESEQQRQEYEKNQQKFIDQVSKAFETTEQIKDNYNTFVIQSFLQLNGQHFTEQENNEGYIIYRKSCFSMLVKSYNIGVSFLNTTSNKDFQELLGGSANKLLNNKKINYNKTAGNVEKYVQYFKTRDTYTVANSMQWAAFESLLLLTLKDAVLKGQTKHFVSELYKEKDIYLDIDNYWSVNDTKQKWKERFNRIVKRCLSAFNRQAYNLQVADTLSPTQISILVFTALNRHEQQLSATDSVLQYMNFQKTSFDKLMMGKMLLKPDLVMYGVAQLANEAKLIQAQPVITSLFVNFVALRLWEVKTHLTRSIYKSDEYINKFNYKMKEDLSKVIVGNDSQILAKCIEKRRLHEQTDYYTLINYYFDKGESLEDVEDFEIQVMATSTIVDFKYSLVSFESKNGIPLNIFNTIETQYNITRTKYNTEQNKYETGEEELDLEEAEVGQIENTENPPIAQPTFVEIAVRDILFSNVFPQNTLGTSQALLQESFTTNIQLGEGNNRTLIQAFIKDYKYLNNTFGFITNNFDTIIEPASKAGDTTFIKWLADQTGKNNTDVKNFLNFAKEKKWPGFTSGIYERDQTNAELFVIYDQQMGDSFTTSYSEIIKSINDVLANFQPAVADEQIKIIRELDELNVKPSVDPILVTTMVAIGLLTKVIIPPNKNEERILKNHLDFFESIWATNPKSENEVTENIDLAEFFTLQKGAK